MQLQRKLSRWVEATKINEQKYIEHKAQWHANDAAKEQMGTIWVINYSLVLPEANTLNDNMHNHKAQPFFFLMIGTQGTTLMKERKRTRKKDSSFFK